MGGDVTCVTGLSRAWERGYTSLSRRFAALCLPPRSSPHTMSSLRLHPSLPAPVVSSGASLQAKSSVLTGVQDAYWSDEEVRRLFFLFASSIDAFCRRRRNAPCASRRWIYLTSTSNLASANTRYLTSFYYSPFYLLNTLSRHRFADFAGITSEETSIISALLVGGITPTKLVNLNRSTKKSAWFCLFVDSSQFDTVICSQRRLVQQKKQRERERKDLDTLSRRHLANVRVVQRNVVYVVGIGPRFAKEEVRPLDSIYFWILSSLICPS
jgi:hypothetical protein